MYSHSGSIRAPTSTQLDYIMDELAGYAALIDEEHRW